MPPTYFKAHWVIDTLQSFSYDSVSLKARHTSPALKATDKLLAAIGKDRSFEPCTRTNPRKYGSLHLRVFNIDRAIGIHIHLYDIYIYTYV